MGNLKSIDLETGDTSQFDSVVATPTVTQPGLAGTANKLEITLGAVAEYGITSFVWTDQEIHVRWYQDQNDSASAAGTDNARVVRLVNSSANEFGSIINRIANGATEFVHQMRSIDDLTSSVDTNTTAVTDAEHYMEFVIKRAATDVSVDATFEYFIDGVSRASKTAVDLFDRAPSGDTITLQWGASIFPSADLSGQMFLDQLLVRETVAGAPNIGELGGGPFIPTYRRRRHTHHKIRS